MAWLFVYGTLRAGEPASGLLDGYRRIPAILPDHALFGGERPYPFVVRRHGSEVIGEVVSVPAPDLEEVLAALDDYEGDEYRRITAPVLFDGRTVDAHLWIAVSDQDESDRIPSGDWRRM